VNLHKSHIGEALVCNPEEHSRLLFTVHP